MTIKNLTCAIKKQVGQDLDSEKIQYMFMNLWAALGRKDHKLDMLTVYNQLKLILDEIEQSNCKIFGGHDPNEETQAKFLIFKRLVERDFRSNHKVLHYSNKIGLSTKKLSSICCHYTGKNAKAIIDSRILSESKKMLQNSKLSVKEIARDLGFSDQYQFSKYFKKHVKSSPLSFRRVSAFQKKNNSEESLNG